MNTQYLIKGSNIRRYYDGSPIRVECFNADTYAREGYDKYLNAAISSPRVGDVIIEVVGVVRERPKFEKRPAQFVVGEEYRGDNGSSWRLLAIMEDRMVFEGIHGSDRPGIPLFTKLDGSPWRPTHIGIRRNMEDVQVGVEKYIDKENI